MNIHLQECCKSKNTICQESKKKVSRKRECLDRVAEVTKLLIGGNTVHKHVVKGWAHLVFICLATGWLLH